MSKLPCGREKSISDCVAYCPKQIGACAAPIKKCQGECPKCGSQSIDIIDREGDDETYLYLIYWCRGCNCQFNEEYKIEYQESSVIIDDMRE